MKSEESTRIIEAIGTTKVEETTWTSEQVAEKLNRTKVDMKNFKWEMSERKDKLICDGDLRIANLPVKVIFEWSNKIVADYDSETNTVLEHTSGYVMKVLPDQSFVYKGEESTFIASTFKEAQK